MRSICAAFLLAILPLAAQGQSACRALPVDPDVVGKTINAPLYCNTNYVQDQTLRIASWAVYYEPISFPVVGNARRFPACREQILSVFTGRGKQPELIHRPAVLPSFFNESHPDLITLWQAGTPKPFPCNLAPWKKVVPWGTDRPQFISLLTEMTLGVRSMRDSSCWDANRRRVPNWSSDFPSCSWSIVDTRLERQRVADNIVSYLQGVAVNADVCINFAKPPASAPTSFNGFVGANR